MTKTLDRRIAEGACLGFAYPGRIDRRRALEIIAEETCLAVVDVAISSFGELLAAEGPGIVSALQEFQVAARSDFETAWSPGLGPLIRGLQAVDFPAVRFGVVQTLLHGCSNGLSTRWQARFERPYRFSLGDLLLPPTHAIDVVATGAEIRVRLTNGGDDRNVTLSFISQGRLPVDIDRSDLERMPVVRAGQADVLLCRNGVLDGEPHDSLGAAPGATNVQAMVDTLSLLRHLPSQYDVWVTQVVRRLTLWPRPSKGIRSSTRQADHGTSSIVGDGEPVDIGALLIHESAHQYFNLALRTGPVVDPGFFTEFYSPFARRLRQLDRLLYAYHAFANVRLYYDECRRLGIADVRMDGLDPLPRQLREVELIINQHRQHLTGLGRELFDPLFAERPSER